MRTPVNMGGIRALELEDTGVWSWKLAEVSLPAPRLILLPAMNDAPIGIQVRSARPAHGSFEQNLVMPGAPARVVDESLQHFQGGQVLLVRDARMPFRP